jgi:membrane protease YdiL (CAAX protease family)
MKKALIYLLEFLALQIIGGFVVSMIWQQVTGSQDVTVAQMITSSAVVGVLVVALFLLARWAEVSPAWLRTRPWGVLTWSVLAAMGAIIPSVWLQEQMPELPNLMENEFNALLQNRWGYVVIGLLAPLSEELVFRGAILRSLLRQSGMPVWGAVALSAVFFALIHFNPAQMPHAFLIGLLLGWMYWRTGSILPGVAYHWTNNSIAYIFYNLYPDPDMKLADLFGGSERHVLMAVGFSMLILLPALYQLHLRMCHASEQE